MAPALQISIPHTSISATPDSKPFTLYHIVLQLPLRKHELPKRYTDFSNLHAALISETNAPPPTHLPAKSWLRRTVNNDTLTEDRRQGLERYVQTIVDSDDARWRSSSAWRAFLNLPSGTANGTAAGTRPTSAGLGVPGGIADPNQWLDVHRELKSLLQTARQQLKQREAATTAQSQHALSADAKSSLVRAAAAVTQLEDGLKAAGGNKDGNGGMKRLGDGEIRRRRDLLGAAKKEVEGLEAVLRSLAAKSTISSSSGKMGGGVAAATDGDREALWRGTGTATGMTKPGGRVLGGPLKETARTRELDNAGVLQLQQQVMAEQDEDVMALGKTVAKLKDMGILMDEELTVQNEMLGLVEQDADRLKGKIDVARRRIGKIS